MPNITVSLPGSGRSYYNLVTESEYKDEEYFDGMNLNSSMCSYSKSLSLLYNNWTCSVYHRCWHWRDWYWTTTRPMWWRTEAVIECLVSFVCTVYEQNSVHQQQSHQLYCQRTRWYKTRKRQAQYAKGLRQKGTYIPPICCYVFWWFTESSRHPVVSHWGTQGCVRSRCLAWRRYLMFQLPRHVQSRWQFTHSVVGDSCAHPLRFSQI